MLAEYNYSVRDKAGKEITGTLEADNADVLAGKLNQMGYTVMSIDEVKVSLGKKEIKIFGPGKVESHDIVIFTRQFATMINAGLPLIKCLNILSQQTESKPLVGIIVECQKDVESGRSLSDAMAKHSKVFPRLYVSMVKAGELGGMLDDVLLRIANQLEREEEIRHKIKSAMTYPMAIGAITLGLLALMIIVVIPKFATMFESLGGKLPGFTQLLVDISHFVGGIGGVVMLIMIIAMVIAFRRIKATDQGRFYIDKMKLSMPVVGVLFHKNVLSRFSRTLGTLLASGVPILGALEITGETTGNMVVSRALDNVRESVKEGETIAQPLAESKVFPPMVTQMIAIGEETGALDVMLGKVSDFYDTEVNTAVDGLTSTLEPVMMAFMGGTVGVIVVGLYLPIFKVITVIK